MESVVDEVATTLLREQCFAMEMTLGLLTFPFLMVVFGALQRLFRREKDDAHRLRYVQVFWRGLTLAARPVDLVGEILGKCRQPPTCRQCRRHNTTI